MSTRDPRLNPLPGDVLQRWGMDFKVTGNSQGCVYTCPSLSEKGWVGLLFFRAWAAFVDVVHVEGVTES